MTMSGPWAGDISSADAVEAATAGGSAALPPRSLALYARWWQLETWLRELAYVEVRSYLGMQWSDAARQATGRSRKDAAFTHMAGADNVNPLAYLDYSQLVDLIDTHWDRIGYALIERRSWVGRQTELGQIRHRIGHMRRSHPDDLLRLEQTLRDLENGAFLALSSYNRRRVPSTIEESDAVAVGWLHESHDDARRLIGHADRQYGTRFRLEKSTRPWCREPLSAAGAAGQLWHASFYMRDRFLDTRALWNETSIAAIRPLLVHVLFDSWGSVSFTFAAVDDPSETADAIGVAFDAVLTASRHGLPAPEQEARWESRARGARDFRLLYGSGWNLVDETTVPISIFGAGGAVESPFG